MFEKVTAYKNKGQRRSCHLGVLHLLFCLIPKRPFGLKKYVFLSQPFRYVLFIYPLKVILEFILNSSGIHVEINGTCGMHILGEFLHGTSSGKRVCYIDPS